MNKILTVGKIWNCQLHLNEKSQVRQTTTPKPTLSFLWSTSLAVICIHDKIGYQTKQVRQHSSHEFVQLNLSLGETSAPRRVRIIFSVSILWMKCWCRMTQEVWAYPFPFVWFGSMPVEYLSTSAFYLDNSICDLCKASVTYQAKLKTVTHTHKSRKIRITIFMKTDFFSYQLFNPQPFQLDPKTQWRITT